MSIEITVLGVFFALVVLAASIWSGRRVDRQFSETTKLQDREHELLARWEAVVSRLEGLAEKLERRDGP